MVSGRRPRSANGLERYASLTFPFLSAPPSSPLTPHCLQSIGPGLLDRSIALYRAVAVCPSSNHRGPSSCRPMQGSASSRPFSLRSIFFSPHRLPPRQSGTAWPGLSAGLLLGPSSSVPILSAPTICLRSGAHGLWYRHSTILLAQARLFLVSGNPPTVTPPTHEIGCHNPGPSSNKR